MNGRYLIVFLLLGGVLYGLTTAVGNMLAEEDPMSVYSAYVDYPSVPVVGASSRGGSPVVPVPVSSRTASLFRHPAVYSVFVPQGCASADRPAYAAVSSALPLVSESYSASSAYPVSGGLYLTSSATLHSYGGGTESVAYISSGTHSAIPSASSLSGTSMTPPVSVPLSPALSPSWSASPSVATAYASADQTLSARKGAQRRTNGITIEDTYYQWLQSNSWAFGAGADNLSESQVRALWDALCANNDDFALTYTYEEFYNWFLSKQSDETFKWKLPIGEGVPYLLLLCVGYVIVRYKQQKNQWI